ncbi:MAG: TetR/AcrR family transcriptional regulator, partial [Eubacterium sp.]
MDLRIIKTKELIRRVFVGLLQEREFPQITVKELCIRARINRSTFYHHYEDIYALRDELIDSVIDEYTAHMETAFLDIHTFLSD